MKNVIAENVENATITALGENPNYLFSTALIDSRLSRVGRTLADSAQWVLFSFVAAVDVDVVGIFNNNFTSGATVKIQANATDSWGSPSIDQALTYTKDNRRSTELGRDVGVWSYQFSSTESYQYWRIYIDDSSNPETYVEMGFVFLDEATTFPGMLVNQGFPRSTTSEASFSDSGQAYGLKRLQFNTNSFTFPDVEETEKEIIDTFYDKIDIVTPFMLIVWENDLDIQRPVYAISLTLPEWRRVETRSGLSWTFNATIREVF